MTTSATRRREFGTVRQLPSRRFQARYTGPDGKQHSAPYTFVTKTDAKAWLVEQQKMKSQGGWEPPKMIEAARVERVALTLSEYADRVLARRTLSPTTAQQYRNSLDKLILPTFGSLPLAAIEPGAVRDWYGALKKTPSQAANAYGLLKSVLKEAVDDELIERNPCKIKGGSQKKRAKDPEILTPEDFSAYIEAIRPERYRIPLTLALWTGVRSGELRGLRRRDLDLKAGTLRVGQAVVRVRGSYITKSPKTQAGYRTVSLPPHLIPILKEWIKSQPMRGADALLFTARDGETPLSSQTLSAAHIKAREAIGKPGLTPHGLRRSAATLAADLGATLADLMRDFGWDTPAMAAVYTFSSAQRSKDLAEKKSEAWKSAQAE